MGITRTALGAETHKTSSTSWTTTQSFALAAGEQLVVLTAYQNAVIQKITWGQYQLGRDAEQLTGSSGLSAWSILAPRPGTGQITIVTSAATTPKVVAAYKVLADSAVREIVRFDLVKFGTGAGTTPDSGLSASTAEADELLLGAVLTDGPVEDAAGTWEADTATAGQRAGTTGGTDRTLSEGYALNKAIGSYRAKKTGITSRNWIAGLLAYRADACTAERLYHLFAATLPDITSLYCHTMAYYPPTQEIILYGGWNYPGDARTFSFKAGAWTNKSPVTTPVSARDCRLTWDPVHEKLWLTADGATYLEIYEWTGTDWLLYSPPTKPLKRAQCQQWWDPISERLLVWSGGASLTDTWAWDGTSWAQITTTGTPPFRARAGACYDPISGKTIICGGNNNVGGACDNVYLFDSTTASFAETWPAHPLDISIERWSGDSGILWEEDGHLWLAGGADGTGESRMVIKRWTGDDWEDVEVYNPITAPTGVYLHGRPIRRYNHAVAHNPIEGRTVIGFGSSAYGSTGCFRAWEFAALVSLEEEGSEGEGDGGGGGGGTVPSWYAPERHGEYCLEITDARDNRLLDTGWLNRDYTVVSRCRFRLLCRRNQWWADLEIGSRLHEIKTLKDAKAKVDAYAKEALEPLVREGAISGMQTLAVESDPDTGMLLAHIAVTLPEGQSLTLEAIPVGQT